MRVLDLFSGIGGFSLGLERAGMRTVAFCEIDPFCRAVLAKHWPGVPCHDDVRTIPTIGCDLVAGGYPCQPFSHAGKRSGARDDRHLWPAMRRVIEQERPAWIIAENVTGHIALELDQVLADLEADGYACRALVIPACAVGAPHKRERVWILAHAHGERGCVRATRSEYAEDAWESPERTELRHWDAEPGMGRVASGVLYRVDRLRALGNAVVPQVVEVIGKAIMEHAHGR